MGKDTKKPTEVKTTGHEWDGIEEYDNPAPSWMMKTLYACILFAVVYVVLFPSIPYLNGFFKGTLGWSQYNQLEKSIEKANLAKAPFNNKIATLSAEDIQKDPSLNTFAVASGKADFALSCSQCHGAGGGGTKGFPNLLDDEWIWGGKLSDIITTITHGIRSPGHDETRDMGPMMAFGNDEILTQNEVRDVVHHVQTLAYKTLPKTESTQRGETIFANNCAACHGETGEGMRELGAPALNNPVWLYGGKIEDLMETVNAGRAGVMPHFSDKLSADRIKKLALYIHSLGGGE